MENKTETKVTSFLSFRLGDETFAANVDQVLNILEMLRITEVPRTPEYMKGIVNLRGEVLPVIDARLKFGMPAAEHTKNTCILVLEVDVNNESIKVGALVDSVVEVLEIRDSEIKPPPVINEKSKTPFIKGVIKVEDTFIIVLDINKVFTTDEITLLDESTEALKKSPAEETV